MDATTISARSLSKNFAATLDLVADVALRPSFPADEIERQRASRLGQLVQQRDNPGQVAAQVAWPWRCTARAIRTATRSSAPKRR